MDSIIAEEFKKLDDETKLKAIMEYIGDELLQDEDFGNFLVEMNYVAVQIGGKMKPLKESDLVVFGKNVLVKVNGSNFGYDYIPNWKNERAEKLLRYVMSIKEEYAQKYSVGLTADESNLTFIAEIEAVYENTGHKVTANALYDSKGRFKFFTDQMKGETDYETESY